MQVNYTLKHPNRNIIWSHVIGSFEKCFEDFDESEADFFMRSLCRYHEQKGRTFHLWISDQIREFSTDKGHNGVSLRLVLKLNGERFICTWAAYRELFWIFVVSQYWFKPLQHHFMPDSASKCKTQRCFSTLYPALYSTASHWAPGWQTHFPGGVPPCNVCHINRLNVSTSHSGSVSDLRCVRNKSRW